MSAPTVTVEIAFTSTFSTPEGSRTWTDVTSYVEAQAALSIAFGRTDERTQADANSLGLTFDNRDGRFTPEKTTGAYYPNVKLYRPIRITAQYAGGTARTRFVGYVRSWKPGWNGSDATSTTVISAASRLQRLGLADPLRSVLEQEILLDQPVAFYTFGDDSSAVTASDSSPSGNPQMTVIGTGTPFAFGAATKLTTSSATGIQFNGGKALGGKITAATSIAAIECVVTNATASGAGNSRLVLANGAELGVDSTGHAYANAGTGAFSGPSPAITDGAPHHLAVTIDWAGPTAYLYVDGTFVASAAAAGTGPLMDVFAGGIAPAVVSHFAAYQNFLSPTRITAHATAMFNGFAGETVAARLDRFAGWRNIPVAEVDAANSSRTVLHFDTSGLALLDAMRVLEQTESGVLADTPSGHLRLIGESGRYTAVSAFTLDLAQQYVSSDFGPEYDDAQVINDVTTTNVGDQSTGRAINQTSIDSYGRVAGTSQTASTYSDAEFDDATWLVTRYSEPTTRLQSVTVSLHSLDALTSLREAILASDIGTLVTITNLPAQFKASSGTWFIEGWSETYRPGTHDITLNLASSAAFLGAFVLDDATRGVLDSTYYLGH